MDDDAQVISTLNVTVPGQDILQTIEDNKVSTLGGGLTRLSDGRVISSVCGPLYIDDNRCWVAQSRKRHLPREGDFVIGVIVDSLGDSYSVDICGSRLAILDNLAFDGVTRRNCPILNKGAVIFGRILRSEIDFEPQLTCKATEGTVKKDWASGESQFGELKNGCVFPLKTSSCRRLSQVSESHVLQALGKVMAFEICVGVNGRFWVSADDPRDVVFIGNVIQVTQGRNLAKTQAEALVKELYSKMKGQRKT